MRILSTLALIVTLCSALSAQTLVRERTCDLRPLDYAISGDAILEEYDDGSLKLRLSDEFDTPRGPDVRVFLSNGATTDDAVEVVNLAAANHFSGARSFNVPEGVTLDQFSHVFLYCLAFSQPWADGELGPVMELGSGFDCLENTTFTTGEATAVSICPTDGMADVVVLSNSLALATGTNYSYLLTDANGVLQEVSNVGTYDFEGSGTEEQRIYGITYDGDLNAVIGANRLQTTATGCFTHSSATTFLTVTKDACDLAYTCADNATATTDWATSVNICPTDGEADLVSLRNNLFIAPGDHYAYLITDVEERVIAVTTDSTYNFEGSGLEESRVYGLNYDGVLDAVIGTNRLQTTATGCFVHSSASLFLTVTKNGCTPVFECQESLVATHDWVTQIDLCTTDGEVDTVFLQNNIDVAPGEHYAFLLTDTNEIVQEVIMTDTYDFEDSGTEKMRVYGLHYDGELMAAIGETRRNTTATGCSIHSGDDIFITVDRTATCATSVLNRALAEEVLVYPNPSSDLLTIELSGSFRPTQIALVNLLGERVKTQFVDAGQGQFQLEVTNVPVGQYLLRLEDDQRFTAKLISIAR